MTTKPPILITAGPTHEHIDPVRYLANRSSGAVGIALAESAARKGHPTTLLLGPSVLAPEPALPITLFRFQSTADLQTSLARHAPDAAIIIMAAAVADYRPIDPANTTKIPREADTITIELQRTPDLVAQLAAERRKAGRGGVVAFALEPAEHLIERATAKLARKAVDAIVANPIETMDAPNITAHLIFPNTAPITAPPNLPKPEFADWLIDQLT